MKVILVGYPGSQFLVPAGKYLTDKYLAGFEVIYLNYRGEINGWSQFMVDYLNGLEDEKIIFALDDYLVSGPMNMVIFEELLNSMSTCAKLCHASDQENTEYSVTTQYTIWDREALISLLAKVNTPWEFERLRTDAIFGNALPYYTNSALSKRWEGVDLTGLNEEDVREVQKLL